MNCLSDVKAWGCTYFCLGVFQGRLDLGCPRGIAASGFAAFLAFVGVFDGCVSTAILPMSYDKAALVYVKMQAIQNENKCTCWLSAYRLLITRNICLAIAQGCI